MKIPTLLGIAIILTLIISIGVYYFYGPQKKTDVNIQISDLKVVNITSDSATVVWQTSTPVVGEVVYSEGSVLSQTAADNRDRDLNKPRVIHFVTLNNLKTNTKYNYKTKNDSILQPDKILEFKTATFQSKADDLNFSFVKPLKGTILNTNLNPIDESLIFLQIPGAQELATFSSTSGNFVLPLKLVLDKDLQKQFMIDPGTPSQLNIVKNNLQSNIKIIISEDRINLPPITLGSNLDLTNFTPAQVKKISFSEREFQGLDFNQDGTINSLDLALLKEAIKLPGVSSTQSQSKFDINFDGSVNQEDVEAFSKALDGN